jgi:hypothetical protein
MAGRLFEYALRFCADHCSLGQWVSMTRIYLSYFQWKVINLRLVWVTVTPHYVYSHWGFLQALVSPQNRQWAHTRDLILHHPEHQTDSFILYIKGTILCSFVKNFNMRFRAKHFAGDPTVKAMPDYMPCNILPDASDCVDPRGSQAFIELDHIVSTFKSTFPIHLRNPVANNIVDSHLYTASLMPHV